ncbi:MAG: hypothetical protein ACYS8W_15420 [Planctomycetota bacterium]
MFRTDVPAKSPGWILIRPDQFSRSDGETPDETGPEIEGIVEEKVFGGYGIRTRGTLYRVRFGDIITVLNLKEERLTGEKATFRICGPVKYLEK